MSAQVVAWVFASAPKDLRPTETLVALVLAEHANAESGLAYPSVARIANMARISERAATAALKTLVEKNIIAVEYEATNKRPTVYAFPKFRGEKSAPQETAPRGANGVDLGVQNPQRRGENPAPKRNERERTTKNVPPLCSPQGDAPPKNEPKRAKKLPDDWLVSDHLREWAHGDGWDDTRIDEEAENFRFYWGGEGGVKFNWDMAFQTWMRRERKRQPHLRLVSSNGHKPEKSEEQKQAEWLEYERILGRA